MFTDCPPGPEEQKRIDANIFGFDLHVDLFGFGQNRYSDGRRVHTALGLGGGHALHPMHSALVLHLRVHPLAFDDGDHFLQTTHSRFGLRKNLYLPAMLLGKSRVHAEDLGHKERGFVSPGAGADFQDDVLFVIGILGQQHDLDLFFQGCGRAFEARQFFLRHRCQSQGRSRSACPWHRQFPAVLV